MGQETRVFDVFGPKLQIETGNPVMGTPGRSAFSLMSTTDSNVKFVQAHTESGLTKFYSEGTMQFEAGAHPKMVSNNATAFAFIALESKKLPLPPQIATFFILSLTNFRIYLPSCAQGTARCTSVFLF